jgi:hypothetical protein
LDCPPASTSIGARVATTLPTRIRPGWLIYAFRRGETAEEILQPYPSLGSLAKVYGAITLILENPEAIERAGEVPFEVLHSIVHSVFRQAKQFAILLALEAGLFDRVSVVFGKAVSEVNGQTFVQQNPHAIRASKVSFVSSSRTAISRVTVGNCRRNSSRGWPLPR